MNDAALFLGKFLRHGTKIASVAPSSRWLAAATIRGIDWTESSTILELGAGTGPITRAIAANLSHSGRLLAVERDHDFATLLRERFANNPRVEVIEADSRDLHSVLAERGIARVDHVVSGLPVPSFSIDARDDFFHTVASVLDPLGSYRQITELAWVYRGLYRRYFADVQFVFEPRNLPPAGAYHCRGLGDGNRRS